MASETLHENPETLGTEVIDQHRAIVSIMEEFEAVDWYNQRAKAATDDELRLIIEHNRDEEKEHMAMVLEWLRRHDPVLDAKLREYLFSATPISEKIAAEAAGGGESGGGGGGAESGEGDGSLKIGSLRKDPSAYKGSAKSGGRS